MKVIRIKNIGIKFRLFHEKATTLKEFFFNFLKRKQHYEDFWALRNINFDVQKGETIGIIGENGSGKSTLLKILAGIYQPDEGTVEIKGRIASLLELGAGFHEELTGKDNIYLNGSILGLSKKKIQSIYDDIVQFAGLEKFINIPIKKYSSGMKVRLGFAIAINIEPDILLIDEVLAVGDEAFQSKCYEKLNQIKRRGITLVFVSHDMNAVRRLCDRVFLLREGRVYEQGESINVIKYYLRSITTKGEILVLEKAPLTALFNNGMVDLYTDNLKLTRSYGLYSSIFAYGTWHDSMQAVWEKEEAQADEIIIRGKWRRLPIAQHWKFKIINGHIIHWSIDMEILEGANLQEIQVSLLLDLRYKEWYTEFERGLFPPIKPVDIEWIQLNKQIEKGKKVGVKGFSSKREQFPSLEMICQQEDSQFIPSALNTDYITNARVLQFLKIHEAAKTTYKPGIYPGFSGDIILKNA